MISKIYDNSGKKVPVIEKYQNTFIDNDGNSKVPFNESYSSMVKVKSSDSLYDNEVFY